MSENTFEFSACPVCGSQKLKPYLKVKDFLVSKEEFQLLKCECCSHVFTSPLPQEENIGRYYASENYISHHDKSQNLRDRVYKIVRNINLKNKAKIVQNFVPRGTLLDIGCGTGYFPAYMQSHNWEVSGIEPDSTARSLSTNKGIATYSSMEEVPTKEYDVITLWHVLEHLYDLDKSFEFFQSHLKTAGYLIIAVPNHMSLDAIKYKELWAAYDVPRHVHHFSRESIRKIAQKFNYNLVETFPMKFDSYYVSMLSESHRNNSQVNGIYTGLSSNLKAKKTGNYSSLIYVFHKSAI